MGGNSAKKTVNKKKLSGGETVGLEMNDKKHWVMDDYQKQTGQKMNKTILNLQLRI